MVTAKKEEVKKGAAAKQATLKSVFIEDFYSAALRHDVKLEIILPPWYDETPQFDFPVLFLNDGQSLAKLKMKDALMQAYLTQSIPPLMVVGIHAHNRMQEYGVSGMPDFKKRGAKADKYSRFVVHELLPLIRKNFRVKTDPASNAFAGFSLGGLSAFDIAWNYPHIFGKAGAFSGAFWWRNKGYDQGYDNAYDRIMHKIVRSTDSKSNQQFWFQCGTEDEKADRNNNGIIDAIEDTLDLIHELETLGFERNKDVAYFEVEGGKHDEETWSNAMPEFLKWMFGI